LKQYKLRTFFILSKKVKIDLGSKGKCTICGEKVEEMYYRPMEDWNLEGILCGDCYSKQLHEYYPGDHERVNKDLD